MGSLSSQPSTKPSTSSMVMAVQGHRYLSNPVCYSVGKTKAAVLLNQLSSLFVVQDHPWPGAFAVSFVSCFLFQVSPRCFQWKMGSWTMAVGSSLFIAAWAHLTASLTRMEREWSDILARCLWADYLLTSMKVYLERSVNGMGPKWWHTVG